MKDVVFFGIQGSGKGTQGSIVAQDMNLIVFETGGALRVIAQEDSELGREVKSIIESGNLVQNETVMAVVADFVDKNLNKEAILFDGIPRSMEQKNSFDELLSAKGREMVGVWIDISEEEAKRRLLGRKMCKSCKKIFMSDFNESECNKCGSEVIKRSDDNEEAILKRLENFYKETLPAIEKYESEGRIIKINGQQDVKKVTEDIKKALTNI
ncbi:MAG: nucleoside monophosphate kinase [Candidatus Gracilibacteria bacterium]|jgi:adenylate kinase|nr:nucleoside monophosphate kinase [Candidatus Gracilibacteria bacterium]